MARILVVDDDPQARTILARVLRRAAHEVEEAPDGKAALEAVDEGSYDVVVSDIYMPEMDGVEFLIRLHDSHPGSRVIAISGGGWREKETVLEHASSLGAVRTLEKPFEIEELLRAVDEALQAAPE